MFVELLPDMDVYNFDSVLSVHLTSSKSLDGVNGVASEIQKEKKVLKLSSVFTLVLIIDFS